MKNRTTKQTSSTRRHLAVITLAIVLATLAYSRALNNAFVYDDLFEIVDNPYIQHGQYFWTAMTSDVWAFKGQRDEAWSNYWRPVFVAWMAGNYQLFGLDPAGWHVMSLIAHILVSALAYLVALRLGFSRPVSAVVCWLFAVHPVHVESVAWASGIPDVLLAALLMGSFLLYLSAQPAPKRWGRWTASLILYALALLTKEAAIVFPAIIGLAVWFPPRTSDQPPPPPRRFTKAAVHALPFACCGLVFIAVRYQVLGKMRSLAPLAPGVDTVIATIPSMLMFYLRQIVFPIELSPMYGVRAVTSQTASLANTLLPITILLAVCFGVVILIRRGGRRYLHAAAWLLLPLVLALDVRVFLPDHYVHDRYLYLPLFGGLLILVGAIHDVAAHVLRLRKSVSPAPAWTIGIGITAAAALAWQTWRYAPVWGDSIALWERAVQVDPHSAYAVSELGEQYRKADRLDEAVALLNKSLTLNPTMRDARVRLAMIANQRGDYARAEQLLTEVLEQQPDFTPAIEHMGLALQKQGRFDKAIALLADARRRLPYKRLLYTMNIAMLQRAAGRSDKALAELESIKPDLPGVTDERLLRSWWLLGHLYADTGRLDDAIDALENLIQSTENVADTGLQRLRQRARQAITQLKQARAQRAP